MLFMPTSYALAFANGGVLDPADENFLAPEPGFIVALAAVGAAYGLSRLVDKRRD